jgi:hypothetical protein
MCYLNGICTFKILLFRLFILKGKECSAVHKKLLQLLAAFVEYAEERNITDYFITSGTLLGYVRFEHCKTKVLVHQEFW